MFVLNTLPTLVVNAVGTNIDNGRTYLSNLHFAHQNQSRSGNVYVNIKGYLKKNCNIDKFEKSYLKV